MSALPDEEREKISHFPFAIYHLLFSGTCRNR